MITTPSRKLVTIKEAMEQLSMSHTQIYRLAFEGLLELKRIGARNSRVTQASIDEYVESLERVPQRRAPRADKPKKPKSKPPKSNKKKPPQEAAERSL